jgi:hypothetical protein
MIGYYFGVPAFFLAFTAVFLAVVWLIINLVSRVRQAGRPQTPAAAGMQGEEQPNHEQDGEPEDRFGPGQL